MTVAMEVGWQQVAELCPGQLNNTCTPKSQAWTEDPQKILSLMMGKPVELLGGGNSNQDSASVSVNPFESDTVQLNHEQELPLPSGWEKRLDLKSGSISFVNCSTGLSTIDDPRALKTTGWLSRNSSLCLDLLQSNTKQTSSMISSPSPSSTLEEGQLDLELNLGRKTSCKTSSSPVSRASSKPLKGKSVHHKRTPSCSSSEELSSSSGIVVTGCKSCLMYVMLSQTDPVCPRCGSFVPDISSTPLSNKKLKPHSG